MICFRDMTFCGSDCTNTYCRRHFSEQVVFAAREWWGGDDAPIALSDFSQDCDEYCAPIKAQVQP